MTTVKVNGHTWSTHSGKSKDKVVEAPVIHNEGKLEPPNKYRSLNVFTVFYMLINNFLRSIKILDKNQTITELILYYINHSILLMVFFIMSIYKNFLWIYRKIVLKSLNVTYYPNKSPHIIRDDVNKLNKIPKRLSCILNFKDEDDENGGIDGLIFDISELVAWSVSAGIAELNIYEYNGIINTYNGELNRYINKNLKNYFGTEYIPNITIKIPHVGQIMVNDASKPVDLTVNLLSAIDGKPTIVELTKTMSELAVNKELKIEDITIDLINEELIELVGNEPDLLIIFNPNLDLQDYPPWHIRLTEFYWEYDNKDVTYAVFIRALQNYAKSKVNVGK
ncbi:dehydrodolichyl diphosphate synthase complex subunit Nus1p [[Candida] jaroonii]|uniref:Dehydrodolichyl diphosphate synthase complex subunit Nus1p n=1 Tax=[Candida] jaroonii TaxID=467808 RepID=A0ACA9Y3J7_9ASCO|nr:dehydrodolichyl diphosphate synthase complex subunit Nus1p [[Candida] jaroonii]